MDDAADGDCICSSCSPPACPAAYIERIAQQLDSAGVERGVAGPCVAGRTSSAVKLC